VSPFFQVKNPEMYLGFGKHCGKMLEAILLEDPGYVLWMLTCRYPKSDLARAREEALRLVELFDAKPILRSCHNPSCNKAATGASLYVYSLAPLWWCQDCSPYQAGVAPGGLHTVSSYGSVVFYIQEIWFGLEYLIGRLLRKLAEAKGLPKQYSESD